MPPPAISVISRFSKIDSLKKMNVFPLKIGQTASLKNFNLYIIVLLIIFFPLLVWITGENRTKMNKLFI